MYITHDEIGDIVAIWLKKNGYSVAFSNIRDTNLGENPDAIGINTIGQSILIEAKISRSDFRADLKKHNRKDGMGIGNRRVYVTPENLLSPAEIPYGWELWEIQNNKNRTIKVIKGRVKSNIGVGFEYLNMDADEFRFFNKTSHDKSLLMMLCKIIRRADAHGIDMNKYANGNILFNKKKN